MNSMNEKKNKGRRKKDQTENSNLKYKKTIDDIKRIADKNKREKKKDISLFERYYFRLIFKFQVNTIISHGKYEWNE